MSEKGESTIDRIVQLRRKVPFAPFDVVMANGDRYRIEDPDRLAVAELQLHYNPHSGMGIHLRLNQVAAIEEQSEKPAA